MMSGDSTAWRALYWEDCVGGGGQLFLFPLVIDVGGLCSYYYQVGHRHLLFFDVVFNRAKMRMGVFP